MTGTEVYTPQRDYKSINHQPFGCGVKDICKDCKDYYKDQYEKGLVDSPDTPRCEGHVTEPIQSLSVDDFDSEDQFYEAQVLLDPVSWALKELSWEARWYQDEVLSCTARFKVSRQGRRSGKTEGACVGMIHKAITNPYYKVLILAPYELQIQMIYDILRRLIYSDGRLGNSVHGDTKNPQRIEFNNGSVILGMSAGSKTSAGSDKIRGQDAHLIYIDEFDYIPDEDVDAVVAILASHPDCEMWATSTPTGEHKKFFAYCTDKKYGYKEFWIIAQESPTWTVHTEKMLRAQYGAIGGTSPQWEHEILAEFGEQEAGVFKNSAIDRALEEYSLDDAKPGPGHFILGIDWNKNKGTHMVIVEKLTGTDGDSFKLVKKIIIPASEFIQTNAVNDIIKMNEHWNFTSIFVDAGYGEVQIEMLKKFGLQHPRTRLHKKVMGLEMQKQIEIRDPATGISRKTPIKPFLVTTLANALDLNRLILPRSEDTRVISKKENMGVVQQMRNFRLEGHSVHGLPKYSQGQDHTLTALMAAVGGHEMKYGTLSKIYHSNQVGFTSVLGHEKIIPGESEDLQSEIIKSIEAAESRNMNYGAPRVGYVKHAGSIRQQRANRTKMDKAFDRWKEGRGKGLGESSHFRGWDTGEGRSNF